MSLLLPDSGLLFWMLLSFGVVFVVLGQVRLSRHHQDGGRSQDLHRPVFGSGTRSKRPALQTERGE